MNRMQNIGYGALRGAMWLLSRLPLSVHRFLGKGVGLAVEYLLKYRRALVEENLREAFPEKSKEELTQIRKKFYLHMGKIIAEAVWYGSTTNVKRLERSRICIMEGQEEVNRFLDEGKSVFALASHCGNFELMAGFNTYSSYTEPLRIEENGFFEVYKRLEDPVWEKFMKINRISPIKDKKNYDALVETESALRYMIVNKDKRKLFNFITDQHPYAEYARINITFFGRQVTTMIGGAAFAVKYKLPLFYLNMSYREDGNYVSKYTKITDDASTMSVQEIMDLYYRMLEKDIREQPWNYLWSHNRWRIR